MGLGPFSLYVVLLCVCEWCGGFLAHILPLAPLLDVVDYPISVNLIPDLTGGQVITFSILEEKDITEFLLFT